MDSIRNWSFQLYDTEEIIYQERWNQHIKIWIELQNEHTLIELLFPEWKEEIMLTNLAKLQNELKANLDTYLERKRRETWLWNESDLAIKSILFKLDGIPDAFWEKIKNEINTISNPIKIQISKQFNLNF